MIEQLRKEGYKVRIRHTRRLHLPVYNPAIGCLDWFLTKGEFLRLAPNDEFMRSAVFGETVDANGGFTEVQLEKDNRIVSKGKFNFGKQQFNRRVGRYRALMKACGKAGINVKTLIASN